MNVPIRRMKESCVDRSRSRCVFFADPRPSEKICDGRLGERHTTAGSGASQICALDGDLPFTMSAESSS